jgi:hypothetical protein
MVLGSCTPKTSQELPNIDKNIANTKTTLSGDSLNKDTRPACLDSLPIVMVGNWDGDPMFRNRRVCPLSFA